MPWLPALIDWLRGVKTYGVDRHSGIYIEYVSAHCPHGRSVHVLCRSDDGIAGSIEISARKMSRGSEASKTSISFSGTKPQILEALESLLAMPEVRPRGNDGWRTHVTGFIKGRNIQLQYWIGARDKPPLVLALLTRIEDLADSARPQA
jgi:hypothetical protein